MLSYYLVSIDSITKVAALKTIDSVASPLKIQVIESPVHIAPYISLLIIYYLALNLSWLG